MLQNRARRGPSSRQQFRNRRASSQRAPRLLQAKKTAARGNPPAAMVCHSPVLAVRVKLSIPGRGHTAQDHGLD